MLNNPELFEKMSKTQQKALLKWINENLSPRKTINTNIRSYRLKHFFEESEGGFYMTNGEFKGAMLIAGYKINNPNDINWYFNISAKSRCLRRNL